MKITKEIDRIKVTGVDKPTIRELVVYQEYIISRDDEGESHVPSFQFIQTLLREPVNVISETQFQIVTTGEILTKV